MSRRIFLALAVSVAASIAGSSRAAAQSVQPGPTVTTLAAQGLARAELPDAWVIRQAAQQTGRNRTRGALWGGGIGLVAGGILGGVTVGSDDEDGFGGSLVESAATGEAVILGAVVGAGIGALLGATLFAPSRRATPVVASPLRFSVHPSGLVIGVSGQVGIGW